MVGHPQLYLSCAQTSMQCDHLQGHPVLVSFVTCPKHAFRYQHAFARLLINAGIREDGKRVDLSEYEEWAGTWGEHTDAVAGLWDENRKRALKNYSKFARGFPTFSMMDPPEMLKDLIDIARERQGWIGLRIDTTDAEEGIEDWLRETLKHVPEGFHVHCWGRPKYSNIRRIDSFDTSLWVKTHMAIHQQMPFLTPAEAMEVAIKKIIRQRRMLKRESIGGIFEAPKDGKRIKRKHLAEA